MVHRPNWIGASFLDLLYRCEALHVIYGTAHHLNKYYLILLNRQDFLFFRRKFWIIVVSLYLIDYIEE